MKTLKKTTKKKINSGLFFKNLLLVFFAFYFFDAMSQTTDTIITSINVKGKDAVTPEYIQIQEDSIYILEIKGRVCWDNDTKCADASGSHEAWGLYYALKDSATMDIKKIDEYIKKATLFPEIIGNDNLGSYLFFIIPEGSEKKYERGEESEYLNNTGRYIVTIKRFKNN